jgi:nickel/cobalt exporter
MSGMSKKTVRVAFALLAVVYVLSHFVPHAHAQSSLGIGTNEATLPTSGMFGSLLNWVNVQQQEFYRALTGALKAMREDGSKLWVLVGLSFAYGIFHAAGPGHGKAVISSYMLANEVALRRGILLSFISAFLQAFTAIAVMTLVFLVLRGTATSMTDATWFLEVASYALISAFGAWLLWKKAGPLVRALFGGKPAHSLSAAHTHSHRHDHDHDDAHHAAHAHRHEHDEHDHADDDHHLHAHERDHGHDHDRPAVALAAPGVTLRAPAEHHHHDRHSQAHGHSHPHDHHAHHGDGEVCETCGHSHAPDPKMLSGEHFDWRTAWSAMAAVGMRPCSGALIVLSFAFLNGLWAGGILSVLAMAVGTAITVSVLATIAVTAKNLAVSMAGDGRVGNRIHTTIEILGAAFVLILGLLLLGATLA